MSDDLHSDAAQALYKAQRDVMVDRVMVAAACTGYGSRESAQRLVDSMSDSQVEKYLLGDYA